MVKKEKDWKFSMKDGYKQGHNRLSFVIVVKGGECLDVAINSKGGDFLEYSCH